MTSGNKTRLDVAVRTCLHSRHDAHTLIRSLQYNAPNRALRCRTGSVIDRYRKAKSSALEEPVPRYKNTLYNTDCYCKLNGRVCAPNAGVSVFKTNTCVQTVLGTVK